MKNYIYLILILSLGGWINDTCAQTDDPQPAGRYTYQPPHAQGELVPYPGMVQDLVLPLDLQEFVSVGWHVQAGSLTNHRGSSYRPKVHSSASSPFIELPPASGSSDRLKLVLEHGFETERNHDFGTLLIGNQQGEWIPLHRFHGSSDGRRIEKWDLTAWAGQSARLRFDFQSDAQNEGRGWEIHRAFIERLIVPASDPSSPSEPIRPTCGTDELGQPLVPPNPAGPQLDRLDLPDSKVVDLPVVFHIIYESADCIGKGTNLPISQINTQISQLNRAFNEANGGTDVNIRFGLARTDPAGNRTNGVTRHSEDEFRKGKSGEDWTPSEINLRIKDSLQWDPKKYLNVWVVPNIINPNTNGLVYGYAPYPEGTALSGMNYSSASNRFGIVLNTKAVGTSTNNIPSVNGGKTLAHEFGHLLGLIHVWGKAPGCSNDDLCSDTPTSYEANRGCNSNDSSCNSLDPIRNYMNYTDDTCMNRFTSCQRDRMRTALQNGKLLKDLLADEASAQTVSNDPGACFSEMCSLNVNNCMEVQVNRVISRKYPYVTVNASIRDAQGNCITNLKPEDLRICEEGRTPCRGNNITLQPSAGGQLDIAFVMDNSGSLDDEIQQVSANVFDFVSQLAGSGVDYALGLCRYGGLSSTPYVVDDNGQLTGDINYFRNDLWPRNEANGGTEYGYHALASAAKEIKWRPNSKRILIIITDETPDQGLQSLLGAQNELIARDIELYCFVENFLAPEFSPITSITGGGIYDITGSFSTLFQNIADIAACSYDITYQSCYCDAGKCSFTATGELTVQSPAANCSGCVRAPFDYTRVACPEVELTATTQDLVSNSNPPVGKSVTIQARVLDNCPPFPTEVLLYYRTSGTDSYSQTSMRMLRPPSVTQAGLYEAEIPGSVVQFPGVDFFVTCTDGNCLSNSASINPFGEPHQFGVGDNQTPQVSAQPLCVDLDSALTLRISAFDDTDFLSEISLFYRQPGEFLFQEISIPPDTGLVYEVKLSAEELGGLGVEYYLKSVDNYDIAAYSGSPAQPQFATLNSLELIELESISGAGNELEAPAGNFFQWYYNGDLLPGRTNAHLPVVLPGEYTVLVSTDGGCIYAKYQHDYPNDPISIYPNPNTGIFTLEGNWPEAQILGVEVSNALGQVVQQYQVTGNNGFFRKEFDLGTVSEGIYIVEIRGGNRLFRQKLWIQH